MTKRLSINALMLPALFFVVCPVSAAVEVTIVGTVNGSFQIIGTDGTIYEVEDTDLGLEVLEMVGTKVQVIALLEEDEDIKYLTITSYTVLE